MRSSIGICSDGRYTFGRCFERSTTVRKARDEAEEIDLDFRLRRFAGDFGDRAVGPGPLRAAQRLALVQQFGRGLELLVFEEAPDQGLAWILVGILLRRIRARQEHARLDVDERRRHDEELPRHVEVHLLHQVDVVEILPGDERDRNVVDIELALLDEMQEQIERPFEIIEPDRVGLEDGFEFSVLHNPTSPRYAPAPSFPAPAPVPCASLREGSHGGSRASRGSSPAARAADRDARSRPPRASS